MQNAGKAYQEKHSSLVSQYLNYEENKVVSIRSQESNLGAGLQLVSRPSCTH